MPDPTDTDSDGTGDDPTTSPSSTDQPTTTSISETMEPTSPTSPTSDPTGDPSGDPSTGETTGPDVVCGDGEVEGDEVCDDGVNDGAYGGCMADCSALAEHCGDSTINGPEVCDDGVNDDSYGGCGGDCTVLGPHCGDGTVQNAEEMCDNGAANENGSGCNVDCVVSGTLLFEYEVSLGNQCWSYTKATVDADANVLIAYQNDCDQVWTFQRLTPELEEAESNDALLSTYPFRATMRGADWLLGAYDCDVLVTEDLEVTEICDAARIAGGSAIEAVDDEVYITMQDDTIAQWGAASPIAGDTPDWTATDYTDGTDWYYYFNAATPAALGSVIGAGRYGSYNGSVWTYYGYLHRFNSAGNSLNANFITEITTVNVVHDSPSGAIFATGYAPSGNDLVRLNANLNVSWAMQACPPNGSSDMEVDSADRVVLDCAGEYPARYIRKLDDEGNELWSVDIDDTLYNPGSGYLVIDPDDNIIRISTIYDSVVPETRLRVEKFAP